MVRTWFLHQLGKFRIMPYSEIVVSVDKNWAQLWKLKYFKRHSCQKNKLQQLNRKKSFDFVDFVDR